MTHAHTTVYVTEQTSNHMLAKDDFFFFNCSSYFLPVLDWMGIDRPRRYGAGGGMAQGGNEVRSSIGPLSPCFSNFFHVNMITTFCHISVILSIFF